ncbi:heavy metal translocating P-type ATPase [Ethanoligenens sp.]|uniref:heavy metal translocating P-type ATPase n=1 Tax=Ethanoligenens sp. TaxID=2099655 RepID=UPI0039E9ECE4
MKDAVKKWLVNNEKRNVVLVALSAVALILSLSGLLGRALPFDIAWVAILLCGIPIVAGSITALVKERDIKADVLVSIALIASIGIKAYFAAGEVALIMAIGTLLEDATARKARKGIQKLINLTPKTARVKRNGGEEIIPAGDVEIGDVLVVLAGETIAVDGIVLAGQTSIDQSAMTGESIPVDKTIGDEIISGTVNQFGTFEMRAAKAGSDSSLQRMIRIAEDADANKAPIVKLADRWAAWLVVVALGSAGLTWLITGESIRAVTVLVVFCPCAFILATPTAVMAGIGNATRFGILVRSGDALQRFSQINCMAFDKTGTLTYGKPDVIGVESCNAAFPADKVLELAALVEQRSEHPLGKSILAYYLKRGGQPQEIQNFVLATGMGVAAKADGRRILVGKADYLEREGIQLPDSARQMTDRYVKKGATVIYVCVDERFAGMIALADVLRETAKVMIAELKSVGVRPVLLTGDNEVTANYIASQVGIEDVAFNMLPEGKMNVIREYADKGHRICMVGDGINDALALKTAYAGIAMGGVGSDIAVEAADAVLVSDHIERVPYLFQMAKKSMRRINFNITVAMIWNCIAVILSSIGVLNPVTAALVHNVGSVFVVTSSALLITSREN